MREILDFRIFRPIFHRIFRQFWDPKVVGDHNMRNFGFQDFSADFPQNVRPFRDPKVVGDPNARNFGFQDFGLPAAETE